MKGALQVSQPIASHKAFSLWVQQVHRKLWVLLLKLVGPWLNLREGEYTLSLQCLGWCPREVFSFLPSTLVKSAMKGQLSDGPQCRGTTVQ